MNLWPVEHVCPHFFSRSALIWKKKVRTKVRGSFVLNKVTSYKIPILAVQQILKKFFPLSRRLNPIMGPENSLTNLKMAEHHRTPKTKQQKSAKRSSALATKQVAFVRQVSKRVPRCGAVRTAGPNTKFSPKIRSKHFWNWLIMLMFATIHKNQRHQNLLSTFTDL